MSVFSWVEPDDINEAINILDRESSSVIYAGGTDVLPLIKYGLRFPKNCVSLGKISFLKDVQYEKTKINIGSMVEVDLLAKNKILQERFPALTTALMRVASPQIRNMATIGGNILQERRCKYFNQSEQWRRDMEPCFLLGGKKCYQIPKSNFCRALYYSDLATPLMAYGVSLEIFGKKGFREIKIEKLFNPDGTRNIGKEEILTRIIIKIPYPETKALFVKESIRSTLDFPIANLAIVYSPEIKKISIVVGGIAPYPVKLLDTEDLFTKYDDVNTIEAVKDISEKAYQEAKKKCLLISEVSLGTQQKMQRVKVAIKHALGEILLNSKNTKGDVINE